jgi:DNA-binding transcriptional ArsR family regulator
MSLGEEGMRQQTALRAMAHPVRLRIMSLLTGAALTAADVARELGLTHANASYHLRHLFAAGMIVQDGEERIRGGIAKRYRYDLARDRVREQQAAPGERQAIFTAAAHELLRRLGEADWQARDARHMTDAELWIEPEKFQELRDRMHALSRELHEAARAPRTLGTVRTSTSVVMFAMKQPEEQ